MMIRKLKVLIIDNEMGRGILKIFLSIVRENIFSLEKIGSQGIPLEGIVPYCFLEDEDLRERFAGVSVDMHVFFLFLAVTLGCC